MKIVIMMFVLLTLTKYDNCMYDYYKCTYDAYQKGKVIDTIDIEEEGGCNRSHAYGGVYYKLVKQHRLSK